MLASFCLEQRIEERGRARHRSVGEAQFGAVTRDGRQLQRLEEQVELGERTAAHEGERAADALGEPLQRNRQVGRNHDLERRRREVEDGPVDIEQNGLDRKRYRRR